MFTFSSFVSKNKSLIKLMLSSSASILIIILGTLISIVFNLLLTNNININDVGRFYLLYSYVMLVSTLSKYGLENGIIKYISEFLVNSNPNFVNKMYKDTSLLTIFTSFLLSLTIFSTANIISSLFSDPNLAKGIKIISFSLIPITHLYINASFLKGMMKVAISVFITNTAIFLFNLIGIIIFIKSLNLTTILYIFDISALSVWIISYFYYYRIKKFILAHNNNIFKNNYKFKNILLFSLSLYIINLLVFLKENISTYIIGYLLDPQSMAIYNVSIKVSSIPIFLLLGVNSVLAPKFAKFSAEKNWALMEKYARTSETLLLIIGLPIFLIYYKYSGIILSIFGTQYIVGRNLVIILSIGNLFNISVGVVHYVLIMSKEQNFLRNNIMINSIIVLIFYFLFTYNYGIIGTAWSYTIGLILFNTTNIIYVYYKLKILIVPFPKL